MADFRRRRERAARRSLVEILAEVPRPALVLADLLQVPARHVEAHRVAKDVCDRVLGGNPPPLPAYCDHHLGLVVQVRGLRWIVDVAPERHQRMGRLDEEKRLFAPVAAHLLMVLYIVAADAPNTWSRQ